MVNIRSKSTFFSTFPFEYLLELQSESSTLIGKLRGGKFCLKRKYSAFLGEGDAV